MHPTGQRRRCCLGRSFWLLGARGEPGGFVPSLGKKGDFQPELQTAWFKGEVTWLLLLALPSVTPLGVPSSSWLREQGQSWGGGTVPCSPPGHSAGSAGMVFLGNCLGFSRKRAWERQASNDSSNGDFIPVNGTRSQCP